MTVCADCGCRFPDSDRLCPNCGFSADLSNGLKEAGVAYFASGSTGSGIGRVAAGCALFALALIAGLIAVAYGIREALT